MQIDKSACNKPLTLNCEVNSNPSANITWYRRRLNRIYVEHLRAAYEHDDRRRTVRLLSSVVDSSNPSIKFSPSSSTPRTLLRESLVELVENNNNNELVSGVDLYEDEMVGTGPTYTIASFNCANLVRTFPILVRNSSADDLSPLVKSQRIKRNSNKNNNDDDIQETLYSDSAETTTSNPEDSTNSGMNFFNI